jgi:hypothetical protein
MTYEVFGQPYSITRRKTIQHYCQSPGLHNFLLNLQLRSERASAKPIFVRRGSRDGTAHFTNAGRVKRLCRGIPSLMLSLLVA